MSNILPISANLEWLKKAAKQQLRAWQAEGSDAKLADSQLALARQYGFSSWRALRAEFDTTDTSKTPGEIDVAAFLRLVGDGELDRVGAMITADLQCLNAVGPHPYWGGRPQALHVAVETKRPEMVTLLLEAGAEINGRNDEYEHWSPLMLTYRSDHRKIRDILVGHGARIGLFEALLAGDDDHVEAMLKPGKSAIPEVRPLGLLGLARTPFAVDRLLALDISPHEPDRWGAEAIEALSRLGPKGRPLVERLQSRGIEATPQEYARLGDMEALAALYRSAPDNVVVDGVLMSAVDFGHCDLVHWLLERGARVNAPPSRDQGGSALHSAAWNGDLPMVTLLIEKGADLAARDPYYDNSPLGWAEVSRTVTNNPDCDNVIAFLKSQTVHTA